MEEAKEQLLKKYLKGQCTERELREVKALLELPGIEEYMHMVMEQLYHDEPDQPIPKDELDGRMTRMRAALVGRIGSEIPEVYEKKIRPVRRLRYLKAIAACAAICLLAFGIIWQYRSMTGHSQQIVYLEHTNAKGLPQSLTLPDGSIVHIGAGSTLYYPERFSADRRVVELSGTAFFDVQKDDTKPFIIQTGDIRTRVLGTSFKIVAFDGQPMVVAVATGKVAVSKDSGNRSEQLATLVPGQQVTWDARSGMARKDQVDVYALQQWVSGNIYFDEQPLASAIAELQRRFGVTIEITDAQLAAYRVSGTFSADQSIQDILEVLGAISGFEFKAYGDQQKFSIYRNN
ncbi:ferric-dicitrate binding protein FerR, regulates iron transport through sigma-19 [Parapedobacter composti]|uniref:Ferric-dicitrate binding protein FerR, regulates iron transport through sigma-19 n=1 Tax=Parapedobacter composti TaxID=623281 RepID=A0A1I1FC11_9SPHI|nr:FecR domain-containing protein [Parapedobacter composti]SFB96476.1 ferric-dicitrate binding protein FerR, regulates iron transport through sigma-19 [Parapedobacter composti]